MTSSLDEKTRPLLSRWSILFACVFLGMLAIGVFVCFASRPLWIYEGELHGKIKSADRVVVRSPEHDWPDSEETWDPFEITDPAKIQEVFDHLVFEKGQYQEAVCACSGYPWIEWYEGETHLATGAVKHGDDIYWHGSHGQAVLTEESSEWLVNWLIEHGIPRDRLE